MPLGCIDRSGRGQRPGARAPGKHGHGRRLWLGVVAAAVAAVLGGCSRGTRPELGEVHGTVTLDGRPLAQAIVVFTPVEGGRQSMGVTDGEGAYTLHYIRDVPGAKVGPHTVAVTLAEGAQSAAPIPEQYNTKTTLRRDVGPGVNQHDLPLVAKSAPS